ncbi:MAG: GGDEF domain-containing protein [Sphingomonadaceae bacterium]
MLLPPSPWKDDAADRTLLARLLRAATRVPTGAAVLASVVAVVLVVLLDVHLGPGWSLGLFYSLPIAFIAWRLGRLAGLVAAIAAALGWHLFVELPAGADPALSLTGTLARAVSYMLVALLVAEMRLLFEHERGLARHDGLTGALVGRSFRDVLEREVAAARAGGRSLVLAYVDLDDFKQVNDRHGHDAGDEILCAFAGAARAALGPFDHLARIGGDEFVVLLVGHDGCERRAIGRFHAAVGEALGGGAHPLSCTLGAIIVPPGQRVDPRDLVRRADAAMFEAKRAGKGSACVFDLGASRGDLRVAEAA